MQQYRIKLRAVVHFANYFRPIILKFETLLYNSNSKIACKFIEYGSILLPYGGADQMVQWFGKPVAVPEVQGSNPG